MAAKKPAVKAPAKKSAPDKKAAPVKKAAPAKKAAPVKKAAPAKKAAAPVKKAVVAKKAVAPAKPAAKKSAPAKTVPAKKVVAKAAPAKPVAKKAAAPAKPTAKPATKTVVKKAEPVVKVQAPVVEVAEQKPVIKRPVPTISANKPKKQLAPNGKPLVREDESPWTPAELKEVRKALNEDIKRLEEELVNAEAGLEDLIRDSGDGAGDDAADAGSKTFEREHEMSLANNAREMLLQVGHAIARLDDGTYGACESCNKPIGKYRLQAFPRATLCLVCKQAEERLML